MNLSLGKCELNLKLIDHAAGHKLNINILTSAMVSIFVDKTGFRVPGKSIFLQNVLFCLGYVNQRRI